MDLVEGHRFAETDRGERGTGAERKNDGHAGQDEFGDQRILPSGLTLVPAARKGVQEFDAARYEIACFGLTFRP